jgi:hypothetical protein
MALPVHKANRLVDIAREVEEGDREAESIEGAFRRPRRGNPVRGYRDRRVGTDGRDDRGHSREPEQYWGDVFSVSGTASCVEGSEFVLQDGAGRQLQVGAGPP